MKMIVWMATLMVVAGCSYRGAYEGVQTGNRNACLPLPPSEYDECMEKASQPYEEYERERQEVLQED
ncbi:MAG: hypothetical protein MI745_15820 [Pseudomonadales bacterium]|nr:hypothetical protein [Pseudomonadales bacterium]